MTKEEQDKAVGKAVKIFCISGMALLLILMIVFFVQNPPGPFPTYNWSLIARCLAP